MTKTLSAKTLKLVPAINCNLKVTTVLLSEIHYTEIEHGATEIAPFKKPALCSMFDLTWLTTELPW